MLLLHIKGEILQSEEIIQSILRDINVNASHQYGQVGPIYKAINQLGRAQRLINLEIPVLARSLKSSNVELG